jgi:hypothetical protein
MKKPAVTLGISTVVILASVLSTAASAPAASAAPAASTARAAAPALVPGIGAALWGTSSRMTVPRGTSHTFWVAFYSSGPRETAIVSARLANPAGASPAFARAAVAGYLTFSRTTITLPARPAAPVTLTGVPNGAGGTETVTTPNAYVFVQVTVTVPAGAAAYAYAPGDAYESITGQVQVQAGQGITISPGAGLGIAVSTR